MNMSPRNLRACLMAAALLTATSFAAPPKTGDLFPDLSKVGLEGTVPDLQGKVLLVDFWASWCGPCRASFPALKEIAEKYKDKGLVVIGVSLDEDKADMDAFVRKTSPTFTIVRDPKSKLAELLDVQAMPSSFIVDRSGKLVATHLGYSGDATKKEYIQEIERVLAKP